MRSGKSITQSGTTNSSLGTTSVSHLDALTSMEFPPAVTVPEATQTGDLTFSGDTKIVQDLTSATTNIFKDSSFKSMTVNGNITQTSGSISVKTLTCEDPSYRGNLIATTNDSSATLENVIINKGLTAIGDSTFRNFSLLDASDNVVISDIELRHLNDTTTNVQTQINDLSANIQTQLNDFVAVNVQQTTTIDNLRNDHDTHVSNAVLLTGDHTVGGIKTFTSNVLTNGVINTGLISSESLSADQLAITDGIQTYRNLVTNVVNSMSSPGLTDVNIISFTAVHFRRRFNLNCPISLYTQTRNGINAEVYYFFTFSSLTLGLWKNGTYVGDLGYTLNTPLPSPL
ncbi:MAG: hypothetical protein EOO06_17905 [Chitinophagaceae bacterium]|nr:MAG: hypothetical protein EOO06_17905 [Chitinophagaceae bacterium]